jgi:hypothetical protein
MVRHESWGMRHCWLILEARKWLCLVCGRGFRQQFPGILKWQRASEWFRDLLNPSPALDGSADPGAPFALEDQSYQMGLFRLARCASQRVTAHCP